MTETEPSPSDTPIVDTTLSADTTADHCTSNETADADTTPDAAADTTPADATAAADTAPPAATEGGDTDDQVLLDRLAQREERRKKRAQEALERQKEFDPTITANGTDTEEEKAPGGNAPREEEEASKEEAASEPQAVAEVRLCTRTYVRTTCHCLKNPLEERPERQMVWISKLSVLDQLYLFFFVIEFYKMK